jgi:hypothetical protein
MKTISESSSSDKLSVQLYNSNGTERIVIKNGTLYLIPYIILLVLKS